MLHVVPNSAEAYAAAAQFLSQVAADTYVVGSSRAAVADVLRTACTGALAGVHRFDVRGLVYALSEPVMMRAGLTSLHRAPREVLLSTVAAGTELAYVRDVARFPGFARALGRTLEELRTQRVSLSDVRKCGRSGPDIAALAERYEAELSSRRLADFGTRIDLAMSNVPEGADLLVYAPGPLSRSERELLESMKSRSGRWAEIAIENPPLPGACDFIHASSEALEFVELARRVLHAEIPFDACAVLLRHPARQLPLVQEAFDRAGIPLWLEYGVRHPDRNGRGFLSLLRCREANCGVAEFCDFLGLATLPQEEEQQLAWGQWERLLEQAAVVNGRDRWDQRLSALLDSAIEEYDAAPAERRARRIGAIESLRGFALPLIGKLAALPSEAPWHQWISGFEDLAKHALADTRTIDEALDALRPVGDVGRVSFDAALRTLEVLLGEWREEADESRYGKVYVGSFDQARGLAFDLVCIPGLNEGLFPRPPYEDPLLLDAQRDGLHMPARQDERALLEIGLAACNGRAIFSWSDVDLATGRKRIPSFFAADLLAATGSTPQHSESRIGWSAPALPEDSIDDSEFDLSCLREAFRGRGNMAWLANLNAHTARAIQTRLQRWSPQWTAADGFNADSDFEILPALRPYLLTERPWAPTSLNQFARCPYRFFLHGVLRLREREHAEPFSCLDARQRGHVYHQALQQFYESGQERTLEDCVAEAGAKLLAQQAPVVPGLWQLELRRLLTDLKTSVYLHDPEWIPVHAECEIDEATLDDGCKLKGTVDLIEQHCTDGTIRILDHKTGKPPFRKYRDLCIGNGEVLQPMLYALAWEALGRGDVQSTHLSWGSVRGGFFTENITLNAGTRGTALFALRTINTALQDGFLPAAPRTDGCKGCEYLPVCGPYEEIRIKQKPQSRMTELKRIRGTK